MLIMFVTIGIAIINITIFPPKSILSPSPLLPASAHKLAENSVRYPIPIILKTNAKRLLFMPVLFAIEVISEMALVIDDKIITKIMTPPTREIIIAKSARTGFKINTAMHVTSPTPIILKISSTCVLTSNIFLSTEVKHSLYSPK